MPQGDPYDNNVDGVSEKGSTTLSWRETELQKPSFPTSPILIVKKCLHVWLCLKWLVRAGIKILYIIVISLMMYTAGRKAFH